MQPFAMQGALDRPTKPGLAGFRAFCRQLPGETASGGLPRIPGQHETHPSCHAEPSGFAGCQFGYRPCPPADAGPSRSHLRTDAQHTSAPRKENDIDVISHAKRMYGGTARNQQCSGGSGRFASQKTAQPRPEPACEPPRQLHRRGGVHGLVTLQLHAASSMSFIAIGNARIMKVQGKMKAIRGNSIFTGACKASFSASKKRSARR